MVRSKAARQVRGWMDFYELDEGSFASVVAASGACTKDAVLLTVLDGLRPAFCVARAIEGVTGVDAHDWFVDEPGRLPRDAARAAPPASGEYVLDVGHGSSRLSAVA